MPKYAVCITRVETRVVWAEDMDDAQDVALEVDVPIGKIIEDTTDVRVYDAEPGDEALNDEPLPPCIQAMRCYCAGHARGNPASEPCDTRE